MKKTALPGLAILLCLCGALAPSALAQETAPPPPVSPPPPGAPIRLFQSFVQDGEIQPHVWFEGQGRLENNVPLAMGGDGTRGFLSGILALGFQNRVEAGLTWGGAYVDPDRARRHSGADDLQVFAKFLLRDAPLKISAGGLVKIPTADSRSGLGSGATDWEGFVALRRDFGAIQAVANVGLRQNGDPDVGGIQGEGSVLAGGGVIFELGRRSFGTMELNYETRRYEGLSSDLRLTPGLFLRMGDRGFFRAGVGIGLTDGAPDSEWLAGFGWAY